ncbi:MAG: competence/damage-inducible protein A [Nitrospiraceae bacterium]|nr:competence/damage-inducible protein A [Nitrospiraceae bacterium]
MNDCRIIKTAGIIIIGNEILSGKVQDSNSFYLVSELRALGVNIVRISVIPDEIETIGRECRSFSESFDYVLTSGGVGPTHDDITIAGIAYGFGVPVIRHPALEERFRSRYGGSPGDSIMKMAEVPEGAEVVDFGNSRFPLVVFKNIFIFPGIPQYLREKFSLIKERFRCSAVYLKKLFLDAEESDIAAALNGIVDRNHDVSFGSYPVLDNPEYRIVITAESRSEDSLKIAFGELLAALPGRIIVRTE